MTTDSQDNDPSEKFHFPPHPDEGGEAAFLASPAKPATPTAQVETDVGQPVEGGGSPDGSQTVPVWIISNARARRSGYRGGLAVWWWFRMRDAGIFCSWGR